MTCETLAFTDWIHTESDEIKIVQTSEEIFLITRSKREVYKLEKLPPLFIKHFERLL